jgi:hypothetical protein
MVDVVLAAVVDPRERRGQIDEARARSRQRDHRDARPGRYQLGPEAVVERLAVVDVDQRIADHRIEVGAPQ